jgi:hypothetical protein
MLQCHWAIAKAFHLLLFVSIEPLPKTASRLGGFLLLLIAGRDAIEGFSVDTDPIAFAFTGNVVARV